MTRVCAECGRTVYPNAEGHTHGVTGPSATEGSSLDTDLATLRRIIDSVRPDAVPALGRVEDELSRLRGLIEGSATDEAILQAAEARCARLQQALWAEVRWQEEEYGSRHPARDILEGPDTPADSQERCGSFGCVLPKGHNQGRADVPSNHLRPFDLRKRALVNVAKAAEPFAGGPIPCACIGGNPCPCRVMWREREKALREALAALKEPT